MNCERAQALISARMDGEHLGRHEADAVEAHTATCDRCRAFADGAARVRTTVRIRAAEPTPDLVEPIMVAVASVATQERADLPASGGSRPPARFPGPHRRRLGAGMLRPPGSLVAAAVAGALVGSVLVGGPWRDASPGPPGATAVARSIRGAAPALEAFSGSYVVHEYGLDEAVPERVLDMDVSYLAPQRFRLDVRDATDYPSSSWTPTDLTFIEDMPVVYRSGPTGCPGDSDPGVCPPTKTSLTTVTRYSAAAPLPADLVLPLATFGSARGVQVVGTEELAGRPTVHVRLTFARAAPLFAFLRLGGTWRPFFDRDRVELWLDADSWSPVRYEVYPADDPERRQWELRFARDVERPDRAILQVDAQSISETPPRSSSFAIPGGSRADRVPLGELESRLGYLPATPTSPGGLALASAVALPSTAARAPTSILVYTDGLEYLRVAEDPVWSEQRPFGVVDETAQAVELGRGVAYYEPSGEGLGRRLAVHADTTDLFLETNLPRAELLEIASSFPVRGEPFPRAWVGAAGPAARQRVGIAEAVERAGLPSSLTSLLPPGYVVASAVVERGSQSKEAAPGVTFFLRQRDVDAVGSPLVLHVQPGGDVPPPSAADQERVSVGADVGRWTPSRSLLEWVHADSYRSLQGVSDLSAMLAFAERISEATA